MRTLDPHILAGYGSLNKMLSMDKEPKDAACWNWALYGLKPLPVAQPDVLFGYVNRGATKDTTRSDATTALTKNAGKVWDNLQAGQALRTRLDQIRTHYDAAPDNAATRNTIRDQVFEVSVQAAGFTLSAAATPYRLCMIEPKDVVMWDHWWLEINGAVVETVTGDPLYGFSSKYLAPAFSFPRNRVSQAPKLGADLGARVHSRYVTSLQDTQAGYLEILLSAATT